MNHHENRNHMSRNTVIELWSGIDAYVKEISDFFGSVAGYKDADKVLAVDQLLHQSVIDGNALLSTCQEFVHVIADKFGDIEWQAHTLLATTGAFTAWMQGLLVRYEMTGQEEEVTEEIDIETESAYVKLNGIKNAAAACASAVGIIRSSAERHGVSTLAGSDDEYSGSDHESGQENDVNV